MIIWLKQTDKTRVNPVDFGVNDYGAPIVLSMCAMTDFDKPRIEVPADIKSFESDGHCLSLKVFGRNFIYKCQLQDWE